MRNKSSRNNGVPYSKENAHLGLPADHIIDGGKSSSKGSKSDVLFRGGIAVVSAIAMSLYAPEAAQAVRVPHGESEIQLKVTALDQISSGGFTLTVSVPQNAVPEQNYRYGIIISEGKSMLSRSTYSGTYAGLRTFYSFSQAKMDPGASGRLEVEMLGTNGKVIGTGLIPINYPKGNCGTMTFLSLQSGTVSCSGFNVDLIGFSTLNATSVPTVTGGLFYTFMPDKQYAPILDKEGQSTYIKQGNETATLYLKDIKYLKQTRELGAEIKLTVRHT